MRRRASFLGRRIDYVMEIVTLEPGRRMAMHAVEAPMPMDVTYEVEPHGDSASLARALLVRCPMAPNSRAAAPTSLAIAAGYRRCMSTPTIRSVYDMWPQYNRRLREIIGAMSAEQLAIRPSPDHWPIWAIVGHTAGARVYWLCDVIGESGAETTPFADAAGIGWEDDLDHSRSAEELVNALDSTFRLIEHCLGRWTPDMLADQILRDYNGTDQVHTRGSILQRLFSHDAYHCGEVSQTLGINGLPQIDLWRPD